MDLLQNPFHILNASPRDNRRRIMKLADERSLLLDSNECMEARSELTNPRKRLSAEAAWLPGIGPKRAGEVLSLIESSPTDLLAVDNLSSIARANLLASSLARLPDHNADDVAEWILEISWAFEDLDPEELSVIVNEERVVSGFPEVSDLRPSNLKSRNGGGTIARSSRRPSTTFPQKNSWRQSQLPLNLRLTMGRSTALF